MTRGPRPRTLPQLVDVLWSRVSVGGPTECWEYQCKPGRYGMMRVANGVLPFAPSDGETGKKMPVTRIVWFLTHGQWPSDDLYLCHFCDNPPCVNPSHLWLGTPSENTQDMVRKRRNNPRPLAGEDHPAHRITDAQVEEIVRLSKTGMLQRDIAARYGIATGTVSAYVSGVRRKRTPAA